MKDKGEEIPDLSVKRDREVLSLIPQSVVHKKDLFPLYKKEGRICVAVCKIPPLSLLQELSFLTNCTVFPVLIPEPEFRKAMMLNYGTGSAGKHVRADKKAERDTRSPFRTGMNSVVREVDYIIDYAIANKISDVHFEPLSDHFRIRVRRDGFLSTLYNLPPQKHAQLISRLKVMARLDIAEKRNPQDGNIQYMNNGNSVDIRVSSLPTDLGEKLVLRILDKSGLLLGLEDLGFEPDQVTAIRRILTSPHGLFIVTGPTGSGKTTTLYSALASLNREDINILTVEDPIEYNMEGITQVRARPELGFTFAKALRTFLRQDPDIIMIGEIRDQETASIAIRAALTGHLVLSTLHTNDAVTTIFRLLDMGIEPFLLCSTMRMIIAQRLVRKICPECKSKEESTEPDASKQLILRSRKLSYSRGYGCFSCNFTGYSGRTVIAELLQWNDRFTELVISGASAEEFKNHLRLCRILDMRSHGHAKINRGITTEEEVLRETGSVE